MSFLYTVSDQLNLRWAWEKVRQAAIGGDAWVDEIELASFELALEESLHSIAREFRSGRYNLSPLRPLAFPKNPKSDGKQQVRQFFHVTVRDQVAWTAVVNIVGQHLDNKMPPWSYGNRLYRSIWIEPDEQGIPHRRIGHYRNSTGHIYLPFSQSWPVFRRHVVLTTAAMTYNSSPNELNQLTKEDEEEFDLQKELELHHRCPFIFKEYWNTRILPDAEKTLFWCSIDLEKFYPSLSLNLVHRNLVNFLPEEWQPEASRLFESMLDFRLDTRGWSSEELAFLDIVDGSQKFGHMPTGLYVAGFLANVSLINVDEKVSELLKNRDVAHFRFVDDHVILAYRFEDLVAWIDEYIKVLADTNTGCRINTEKIEPKELAAFFTSRQDVGQVEMSGFKEKAIQACELNPQFPAPLMTKTLALVSSIAKTDFNLLEESELLALTNQLEHLLLVNIPEDEIPGKTRVTFAATRLTRLAECRLENDPLITSLVTKREQLNTELGEKEVQDERRVRLAQDLTIIEQELHKRRDSLDREMRRTLSLLRKVLQERPDRVRLWSRALRMCRQTGVKGLKEIFRDIRDVEEKHKNVMSADYITALALSVLSSQAIVAAQIICDLEAAEWRRTAAQFFLQDLCGSPFERPNISGRSWFLEKSWEQYCVGIFCAKLLLKVTAPVEGKLRLAWPERLVRKGESCLSRFDSLNKPTSWAWWAVRMTLQDMRPYASKFVEEIGRLIPPTEAGTVFWTFFPFNAPSEILLQMSAQKRSRVQLNKREGWWYDALRNRQLSSNEMGILKKNPNVSRVLRNLASADGKEMISLYEWCDKIGKLGSMGGADPRAGEWTALEIVRQIAIQSVSDEKFTLVYVSRAKKGGERKFSFHPANYRVPKRWVEGEAPTWETWKKMIRPGASNTQIKIVPKPERLIDLRYAPISELDSLLFDSINPVRGLGLLLYGLLRKSFLLPAVWNGPGHSDVLSFLPKLLLQELTCSSWTLGVLQGCLQPRVMENMVFKQNIFLNYFIDNDTLNDPISLLSARQVADIIQMCQKILEENQLSTLNHKARQLTPISIRQLSQPEWVKDFANAPGEGEVNE